MILRGARLPPSFARCFVVVQKLSVLLHSGIAAPRWNDYRADADDGSRR